MLTLTLCWRHSVFFRHWLFLQFKGTKGEFLEEGMKLLCVFWACGEVWSAGITREPTLKLKGKQQWLLTWTVSCYICLSLYGARPTHEHPATRTTKDDEVKIASQNPSSCLAWTLWIEAGRERGELLFIYKRWIDNWWWWLCGRWREVHSRRLHACPSPDKRGLPVGLRPV